MPIVIGLAASVVPLIGLAVLLQREGPARWGWLGLGLGASVAGGILVVTWWPTSAGAAQDLARVCAAATLLWVCLGAAVQSRREGDAPRSWDTSAYVVGLMLGVVAVMIETVVMVIRGVYVAVDLVRGYPFSGGADYGFSAAGLWTLVLVFLACGLAWALTRDRRLWTCQLFLSVLLSSWVCLLMPPLVGSAAGGYERGVSSLLLVLAWSSLLLIASLVVRRVADDDPALGDGAPATGSPGGGPTGEVDAAVIQAGDETITPVGNRCHNILHTGWKPVLHPASHRLETGATCDQTGWKPALHVATPVGNRCYMVGRAEDRSHALGLAAASSWLAAAIVLVTCFHLAVPAAGHPLGFRTHALLLFVSSATAATGCALILTRVWHLSLVAAGMWLCSLALCALATAAVPAALDDLGERYPVVFNALMIALAVCTAVWAGVCEMARQRWDRNSKKSGERLGPHARRMAFTCAALGLVVGSAMAIWPCWPSVAAMDDSMGRITSGVAANLLLLLVMLWSSRRLQSPAFHLMTVMTVICAAGFVMVRIAPFSSEFG